MEAPMHFAKHEGGRAPLGPSIPIREVHPLKTFFIPLNCDDGAVISLLSILEGERLARAAYEFIITKSKFSAINDVGISKTTFSSGG
jgi:hypothetical protein